MNHNRLNLLLATIAISLTACAHQPALEASRSITPMVAEFELTTPDGTRSAWTSDTSKPESASHTSATPTGVVRVFARPGEPSSHLTVSLTQVQLAEFSAADGTSLHLPLSSVELSIECRIAKGETCAVRDRTDKPLVSVRWKS